MENLYVFCVCIIYILLLGQDYVQAASTRRKRNLIQLAEILEFKTKRNPLTFSNYGCYCGWGGQGNPVDPLDKCCQTHDNCYEEILHRQCYSAKYEDYTFQEIEKKNGINQIICDGVPPGVKLNSSQRSALTCEQLSCYCDSQLGQCLARNIKDFHREHYRMAQDICKQ